MLLGNLNDEISNYLVNNVYRRVVNYLRRLRYIRIMIFAPIFRDMLRVLGRIDELFRDLPALREITWEDVREYVAMYVRRILAKVFRYDMLFHRVVDLWMEEYGFTNIEHPAYQILSSGISLILFHVGFYSYSPFRWMVQFPIFDLLLRTTVIFAIIISLLIIAIAEFYKYFPFLRTYL